MQANPQRVPSQVAAALAGAAQGAHKLPQVAGSRSETQAPPQRCVPGMSQRATHAPATQTPVPPLGAAQTRPQPPQCDALVCGSTHDAPQSEAPAEHPEVHRPPSHTGVAPPQRTPQAPQADADARSASQPLRGLPSQSPKPPAQATPQRPWTQVGSARSRAGQRTPQAPQFITSPTMSWQPPWQHARVAPQRVSPSQPETHTPIAQRLPSGQCAEVTHCAQRRAAGSQRGVDPSHWASSRQPSTQALASQTRLAPHWVSVTQATQRPLEGSQRSPPTQTESSVQRGGPSIAAPSMAAGTSGASIAPMSPGASGATRSAVAAASGSKTQFPPAPQSSVPHAARVAARIARGIHAHPVRRGGAKGPDVEGIIPVVLGDPSRGVKLHVAPEDEAGARILSHALGPGWRSCGSTPRRTALRERDRGG